MNVARDTVICRGVDGDLHCTNFHVCFKPVSGFYKWLVGRGCRRAKGSTRERGRPTIAVDSSGDERDEFVEVVVNGEAVDALQMTPVGSSGQCVFVLTGTTKPPPLALESIPLKDGANVVEYIYRNPYGDVSTKAYIHYWNADDHLVVSDIDGTITKSDLIGYVDTVQLGKYDYTHEGICRLYSHLDRQHQVRFVYLTSRPISMLPATRAYLEGCEQDGHRLPVGPIITSTDSLSTVLYKELIDKTIKFYKAHSLMDVSTVFLRAGRDPGKPVFLFGFGNKQADGQAYSAAGVHPDNVFIIDPYSEIRVFGADVQGLGAGEGANWTSPPAAPAPPSTKATAAAVDGQEEGSPVPAATGEEDQLLPGPPFMSYSDARLLDVLVAKLHAYARVDAPTWRAS